MLKALNKNAESERLDPCHGVRARGSVRHHTWQRIYLCEPPSISLLFDLDLELHGHVQAMETSSFMRSVSRRCITTCRFSRCEA